MALPDDSKIRIVAIIPTLEKGGAERVLVNLMNHLDPDRYQAFIFCLKKKGELVGQVDPRIPVIDINYPRVYFSIFRLKKEIKKVKADVVIGWLGNVNAVLAFYKPLLPRKVTVMCRESSIPSLFNQHYRLTSLFNFFYRFYNRFDGIICQSDAMKNDLVENYKVNPGKIRTIHNPVVIPPTSTPAIPEATLFMEKAEKLLLFVGRFSAEKQAGLLLDVMALLPAGYRLLLVGYGPLEEQVRLRIAETGLENSVLIVSNCTDPVPYYKQADCLILASSFEGFPNVLLEANAQGCPVVVYKTKGGAREIVTPENGIYIDARDTGGLQSFAAAIQRVCNDKNFYNRDNIAKKVEEQYSIRKISEDYMEYIEEIRGNKNESLVKR